MSAQFRIVMIGPRGERDYLEKILDLGCPCTCGPFIEHAAVYPEACAKRIAANLGKHWLNPHVAVELDRSVS